MNTSQQEVIETLKSCLPLYKKISQIVNYQPTKDDLSCLAKFKELWDAGLMLDNAELLDTGLFIEEAGFLIGYIHLPEVLEVITVPTNN